MLYNVNEKIMHYSSIIIKINKIIILLLNLEQLIHDSPPPVIKPSAFFPCTPQQSPMVEFGASIEGLKVQLSTHCTRSAVLTSTIRTSIDKIINSGICVSITNLQDCRRRIASKNL